MPGVVIANGNTLSLRVGCWTVSNGQAFDSPCFFAPRPCDCREIAITLRRKSSPDLNSRVGSKLADGGDGGLIAELTKGSRQHLGALLLFPRTHFVALLDESHSFMQDLPNNATEPMGDGPDGGLIAEAGQQTAEHDLKVTAFLGDRSVRSLVQHSTQVFIAFRGTTAMVLLRGFFLAGTGPHPRRQLRRRRECTGLRPYLGDDLLRGIHSQARYFRQSDHRVLMRLHPLRDHAVELRHLLIDPLQPLQL